MCVKYLAFCSGVHCFALNHALFCLYMFAFLRCSRRYERPDGQAGWHNGTFFYRVPDLNGPEGRVYRCLAGAEELV